MCTFALMPFQFYFVLGQALCISYAFRENLNHLQRVNSKSIFPLQAISHLKHANLRCLFPLKRVGIYSTVPSVYSIDLRSENETKILS